MEEWNSQLRRGVLELCILALIETEPRYGYDIVTRLGEAPQLAAGEGTIYPLLRRLKKDRWVDTFWQESAAGPPRQYYRLSDAGQTVLTSRRSEWQQLVAAVNGLVGGGNADHA
ncbi:MAG TPA: PadR family transcriptional regulator [Symbiobacteriaceae bacterium]|jgi:PadR family transcriptional regulator PadR